LQLILIAFVNALIWQLVINWLLSSNHRNIALY